MFLYGLAFVALWFVSCVIALILSMHHGIMSLMSPMLDAIYSRWQRFTEYRAARNAQPKGGI